MDSINSYSIFGTFGYPHIGIYEKHNYYMLDHLLIKSFDGIIELNKLPLNLQNCLDNMKSQPINKIQTLVQVFDGAKLRNMSQYGQNGICRLNYVMHPVLYNNKNNLYEEKRICYSSLYPLDSRSFGVISCSKEFQYLNFDSIDLYKSGHEVYVHQDNQSNWLFSPNNCAFQVLICEPVTFFIVASLYQDVYDQTTKLLITWNTIIWDKDSVFNKIQDLDQLNNFNSAELFLKDITKEIIDLITRIQNLILTEKNEELTPKKILPNIFKYINGETNAGLYHYVRKVFETKIPNFGEKILETGSSIIKIKLLYSYIFNYYVNILQSILLQIYMFGFKITPPLAKEIQELKYIKLLVPEKEIINNLITFVLDDFSAEKLEKKLKELPDCLQNLIFEICWIVKGRIQGISNEFGRFSFLNSPKINEVYFCSKEEICEILIHVQNKLEINNEVYK